MIKEIKYNGHSASPSDYQCPDGDMASMLNCIPERGALKPILPPKTVESFGKKTSVLAIHKISDFEVYILDDDDEDILYWRKVDNKNGKYTLLYDFTDTGVKSVTPIGNTLAVLDGNGTIHYFLWKDSAYKYLGTQLPELDARPYLCTHIYDNTEMERIFGVEFDEMLPSVNLTLAGLNSDLTKKLYDAKTSSLAIYGTVRQNIYERIFALFNMFDRILKQKGYFTSPFFVRFAYRLYDGRHAMHTVPVLLVPTTWGKPLTTVYIKSDGTVIFNPVLSASSLSANIDLPEDFSDWSDIVTHIDTFVTQQAIDYTDSPEAIVSLSQLPYYSYEPTTENGSPEWVIDYKKSPQFMSNDLKWRSVIEEYEKNSHYAYYLSEMRYFKEGSKHTLPSNEFVAIDVSNGPVKLYDGSGILLEPIGDASFLPLPEKGNFDVYLSNYGGGIYMIEGPTSKVYIYKKYTGENATYNPCHHYIELRRTDGKDFADVITDYSNFYKVSEIDVKLHPDGFSGTLPLKKDVLVSLVTHETLPDTGQGRSQNIISHQFSYNNRLNAVVKAERLPSCASLTSQNPAHFIKPTISPHYLSAYVKVMENSQVCYYKLPDETFVDSNLVYFAYPRATATDLLLYSDSTQLRIPLQRHPFLNLAYAFNMFDAIEGNFTTCSTIPDYPQTSILYGNKIKTSDVNNPFIFSEENTSELPVGEIYALSTAAKALSQGQFGQFPLYAFTDKGVWALEVTGTGTYSARQPITRDVVLDAKTVTQIDDAVLFATERGIMLLSGAQVQCISEVLDGAEFDITQLEFAYKKISEDSTALNTVSWDTYKADIQMLYDYIDQRIIVFNLEYDHAYVFSLESKQWGIMESNIQSTVDYYPQAYAMTSDGALVNYSATDGTEAKGHYITRPLKLDAPDVHKTITGIIQRGQFKKGHVDTMLYGSRDLEKWYPVYGSADHILRGMRGTPYKYFRIASTFHLECDESITGCSVDFEPRLNNKLR